MSNKCDWCGAEDILLQTVYDKNKVKLNLCIRCKAAFDKGVCIKCGRKSTELRGGLCEDCQQLTEYYNNNEDFGMTESFLSMFKDENGEYDEFEFKRTMEDCKSDIYTPELFRKSKEAQDLWLTFKLMQAGIDDNKVISENYKDMRYIIDHNIDSVMYKMTLLKICDTPEKLKEIENEKILSHKGNVYFILDQRLERGEY